VLGTDTAVHHFISCSVFGRILPFISNMLHDQRSNIEIISINADGDRGGAPGRGNMRGSNSDIDHFEITATGGLNCMGIEFLPQI
jgi:hypothetical protein